MRASRIATMSSPHSGWVLAPASAWSPGARSDPSWDPQSASWPALVRPRTGGKAIHSQPGAYRRARVPTVERSASSHAHFQRHRARRDTHAVRPNHLRLDHRVRYRIKYADTLTDRTRLHRLAL